METGQRTNRPRSSGFQLLLVVNAVMALLVVVLLAYDYQRELGKRIATRSISLGEEAKALLPAIVRLRHHGIDAVQEYLDAVCGQMQDQDSPGHHIVAQLGDVVLQAHAHHRASADRLAAMQAAAQEPDHRTPFGPDELVVGAFASGEVSVYVAESVGQLRRSSMGDLLRRLLGLLALGIVATGVVNLSLVRIVVRPMHRLVSTVHRIADGELGTQASPEQFRSAEMSYLANAVNTMSASLAEVDHRRALQISKARRIQRNLLPHGSLTPGMKVICFHEPAEDVAGDFYDILPLSDGASLVCIADVSGHGIPAAMAATMLKALLAEATERWAAPSDIMRFVNQRFASLTLPEDFATMALARFQPETGRLDYVNAGHESAWLLDEQGGLRELPSGGLLIGIDPEASWAAETVTVRTRGRLLMTTDGVNELRNRQAEMFGRQRLVRLFGDCRQQTPDEAAEFMRSVLHEFRDGQPPCDDLTLLVAELWAKSTSQSASVVGSSNRQTSN